MTTLLRTPSRPARLGAKLAAGFMAATLIAGCSPKYNWREFSSPDASYQVLFPDKPSTQTREIDLNGMKVQMSLTAASVDGTMFAVGSGVAPDAAHAESALAAMKTALVRNIGGTVQREQAASSSAASQAGTQRAASLDIEANGIQQGTPIKLLGHFEARDKRFYQVIVMGKSNNLEPEQAEMFLSSFKVQ